MNDLTLERYRNDARLRSELKAAAQRERARVLTRFLEQAAQALLGRRGDELPSRGVHAAQPCEAC
jgi:hypothetical protein